MEKHLNFGDLFVERVEAKSSFALDSSQIFLRSKITAESILEEFLPENQTGFISRDVGAALNTAFPRFSSVEMAVEHFTPEVVMELIQKWSRVEVKVEEARVDLTYNSSTTEGSMAPWAFTRTLQECEVYLPESPEEDDFL